MPRKKNAEKRENNIKLLREARGWTQQELAEKTNFTKGHISKLENGASVSRNTAEILSHAFSVPIESIYKEEKQLKNTDIIKIRHIKNVTKYNNFDYLTDVDDYDYLLLGKNFLDEICREIIYNNILIINSPDNTMMPNICQNDLLFIDTTVNKIDKPGVYIIKENGMFLIRRIKFLDEIDGGRVSVKMDNTIDLNFTETHGTVDKFKDKIRGRVIFYTRNIF